MIDAADVISVCYLYYCIRRWLMRLMLYLCVICITVSVGDWCGRCYMLGWVLYLCTVFRRWLMRLMLYWRCWMPEILLVVDVHRSRRLYSAQDAVNDLFSYSIKSVRKICESIYFTQLMELLQLMIIFSYFYSICKNNFLVNRNMSNTLIFILHEDSHIHVSYLQ